MEQNQPDLKKRVQILKHSFIEMQNELKSHQDKLSATQGDFGALYVKVSKSIRRLGEVRNVSFNHIFYKIVIGFVFMLLIYFVLI